MKNIQNKIDRLTNQYDPKKFFPIREGQELLNRDAFIKYKLKTIIFERSLI